MTIALRRFTVLVLALALLLGSVVPAAADPIEDGKLAAILAWLETFLEKALHTFDALQNRVSNTVRKVMYPVALFRSIERVLKRVGSIRSEFEDLACDWDFSFRTNLLHDLWLKPQRLCRPEWQAAWGAPPRASWDRDYQELYDYVAVMTTNVLSEYSEAEHESWDRIFTGQQQLSALARKTPGESARDIAVTTAWKNVVDLSKERVRRQTRLIDDLRSQHKRLRRQKSRDAAAGIWASAAGRDPWAPFEGARP